MNVYFLAGFGGILGAAISLRADLRRRNLVLSRTSGWNLATVLDVLCVAAVIGAAAALLLSSDHDAVAGELLSPSTWAIVACVASSLFLWSEGRHQIQLQRPAGIVAGEALFLFGFYQIVSVFTGKELAMWAGMTRVEALGAGAVAPIVAGGIVLALVLPRFVTGHEEHRILDRIAAQGEFEQQEYVAPTPECPFPNRWKMVDAQSAELEVLEFLRTLVKTVKPEVILETGTFIGHSAINMAEALRSNGFGRIVTIEYDPAVYAKAQENIKASGLGEWIDSRNGSSLDAKIDGQIDILFSDSDVNIREQEVRKFLPLVRPRGLVLIHDASSDFKVVRDAAWRLEEEGLLSVVMLSTPRGLVVAQKREGRS